MIESGRRNIQVTLLYAVLALGLAILRDAFLLFDTSAAVGVDGYYYAKQINSFLAQGKLYYPTHAPVVIYFFSILAHISGDTIFAIKAGTLILQTAFCVGIYKVVSAVTKNVWLGLLGLSIAAFSNLHLYFISEFLNNLGALACLVWAAFAIITLRESGKRIWLVVSFVLSIGAILSHRSTLAILPILLLCCLLSKLLLSPRNKLLWQASVLLSLFILIVPAVLMRQTLFDLSDALRTELLSYPRLPFRELNLPETLMLVLALIVSAIAFYQRKVEQNLETTIILVTVLIWSLFTTLNPLLNHRSGVQGVFGRLDTLAFVQAAVAVPLVLKLLLGKQVFLKALSASCFVGLLIWSFCKPLPYGLSAEYIQRRERLIRELPAIPKPSCSNPLIIARHGDQFLVTDVTDLPAQHKPPEDLSNQCVYWLVDWDGPSRTFSDPRLLQNGGDFALVDNVLLHEFVGHLPESERQNFIEKNPHLKPIFESRTRR